MELGVYRVVNPKPCLFNAHWPRGYALGFQYRLVGTSAAPVPALVHERVTAEPDICQRLFFYRPSTHIVE